MTRSDDDETLDRRDRRSRPALHTAPGGIPIPLPPEPSGRARRDTSDRIKDAEQSLPYDVRLLKAERRIGKILAAAITACVLAASSVGGLLKGMLDARGDESAAKVRVEEMKELVLYLRARIDALAPPAAPAPRPWPLRTDTTSGASSPPKGTP